jgi:hypothetical protein
MKYLDNNMVQNIPIIFPSDLVHDDVAIACRSINGLENTDIVSAGDYDIIDNLCYGESETLNIKSRLEEDSAIILTYDYVHGIRY